MSALDGHVNSHLSFCKKEGSHKPCNCGADEASIELSALISEIERLKKENDQLLAKLDEAIAWHEGDDCPHAQLEHEIERLKAERTWLTGTPDRDDCYIGYNPMLGSIPVWFEKGKFYLYTKGNTPVRIDKYRPLPQPPEEE